MRCLANGGIFGCERKLWSRLLLSVAASALCHPDPPAFFLVSRSELCNPHICQESNNVSSMGQGLWCEWSQLRGPASKLADKEADRRSSHLRDVLQHPPSSPLNIGCGVVVPHFREALNQLFPWHHNLPRGWLSYTCKNSIAAGLGEGLIVSEEVLFLRNMPLLSNSLFEASISRYHADLASDLLHVRYDVVSTSRPCLRPARPSLWSETSILNESVTKSDLTRNLAHSYQQHAANCFLKHCTPAEIPQCGQVVDRRHIPFLLPHLFFVVDVLCNDNKTPRELRFRIELDYYLGSW